MRHGALVDFVVESNDRTYRYRTVPTCRTCQSKGRTRIESAVMSGSSYSEARRLAAAGEVGPTTRSVRRHFERQHHPWLVVKKQVLLDLAAKRVAAQIRKNG